MNLLTETAAGPIVLTPHEAELRIGQLERMRWKLDKDGQAEAQRELRTLYAIAHPEHAFALFDVDGGKMAP